jgi:hypothetical protein
LVRLVVTIVLKVIKQMDKGIDGYKGFAPAMPEHNALPENANQGRAILTLADIKSNLKNHRDIVIRSGDILTPLAADYIKEKDLVVKYIGL